LRKSINDPGLNGDYMNIGITGGSGFIGRYIIELLLEKGISKRIKNIDLEKPRFEAAIEFFHGDIRDEGKIDRFCEDLDCIIHLAAAHHDFGVSDEEYLDVNENGTKKLLAAMEKHRVDKVIFYSSVAVYGTRNLPADENRIPEPDNPYGASKLAAEHLVKNWVHTQAQRKAYIIRPSVVIGPRNEANMFFLIDQIFKGRYLFNFGNGKNIKSMANVKNLVEFTIDLVQTGFSDSVQCKVFNYVDYPQLTSRESITIIHDEMDKKIPKIVIPLAIATAIGKLFDFVILLSGKNLPISSARIKKIATTTHFEVQNLQVLKKIQKRSVESGIREMVRWYLDEYEHK
jgi:nucleoside-diphosphate-sugar epimerase